MVSWPQNIQVPTLIARSDDASSLHVDSFGGRYADSVNTGGEGTTIGGGGVGGRGVGAAGS